MQPQRFLKGSVKRRWKGGDRACRPKYVGQCAFCAFSVPQFKPTGKPVPHSCKGAWGNAVDYANRNT